jgi:hypothetical protein
MHTSSFNTRTEKASMTHPSTWRLTLLCALILVCVTPVASAQDANARLVQIETRLAQLEARVASLEAVQIRHGGGANALPSATPPAMPAPAAGPAGGGMGHM